MLMFCSKRCSEHLFGEVKGDPSKNLSKKGREKKETSVIAGFWIQN
jgi:hypothetical protein